jgi:hypothetical protein
MRGAFFCGQRVSGTVTESRRLTQYPGVWSVPGARLWMPRASGLNWGGAGFPREGRRAMRSLLLPL